jgi:hypothetical protein
VRIDCHTKPIAHLRALWVDGFQARFERHHATDGGMRHAIVRLAADDPAARLNRCRGRRRSCMSRE